MYGVLCGDVRWTGYSLSQGAYGIFANSNRHECGTKEDTLRLLKSCQKGRHLDCWEALYIQVIRQEKVLIDEQPVSDTNPVFELAKIPYAP